MRISHKVRLAYLVSMSAVAIGATGAPRIAVAKDFLCAAQAAAVFPGQRIHIRCNPGDGVIGFFAFSIKQAEEANQILSLAASAVVAGRKVFIRYDPNDLSGAAIGCQTNDCRLIQFVELF